MHSSIYEKLFRLQLALVSQMDQCRGSAVNHENSQAQILSSRYVFSFYPFYFDFHSARIIFDVSSGFYL